MNGVLRRLVFQNVARNVRQGSDYAPAHFKKPTMDDLPVPSGSWQEQYNANQTKYNKHLILGTGFFIVTLVVIKTSGVIYFNWGPPPFPVKKDE